MRCAFVWDTKTKVHNKNGGPSLINKVFIALLNLKIKTLIIFRPYDRVWSVWIYMERCQTCWRCGPRPALHFKKRSVPIGAFKVLDEGPRMSIYLRKYHFRTYPVIWSVRIWQERCETWWECGPGPALRPIKNSVQSEHVKYKTRGIV